MLSAVQSGFMLIRLRESHSDTLIQSKQFYLEDEFAHECVDWTEDDIHKRVAIAPGTISIGTNCDHKVIPVEINVINSEPPTNLREWDHLVQCGINVSSGSVVVSGWFNSWKEASRIALPQGSYIARVCFGNQYFCNGLSSEGMAPGMSTLLTEFF